MGFGYLLIGYLITFVLYLSVQTLGFGGLALLLGYGMMLMGLWELTRFHRAFAPAKWLLIPLLLTACYDLLGSLSEWFLWSLPIFSESVTGVMDWIVFLLMIVYNLAMLYGIRMLSAKLELKAMEVAALRNSVFVLLYAVLYLVANLSIEAIASVRGYFAIALVMVNLVWVIFNLVLLLSCNKNICRAGDEEQPGHRSRFELLNKLNDAYERTRQRTEENAKSDTEYYLRRRQEKKARKHKKHKK